MAPLVLDPANNGATNTSSYSFIPTNAHGSSSSNICRSVEGDRDNWAMQWRYVDHSNRVVYHHPSRHVS